MELGQLAFSNNEWHEHEADWASEGLHSLADAIAEQRYAGARNEGWDTITGNNGEPEFTNNLFEMRSYCWCDGERVGHEEACPPNFRYKPTNLIITWYKHANRGVTSNVEEIPFREWYKIIQSCIDSVETP